MSPAALDPSPAQPSAPVLRVTGLAKRYASSDAAAVFQGVSLALQAGEFVALVGESGVGKSTLLNCIAGLDAADAGEVQVCGQMVGRLNDDGRALLRRQHLGFVFQAFHVLPHLTVAENLALPLQLLGRFDAERVQQMLLAVGLAGLGQRLPAQLSGGQLQRVAMGRALVHRPALILADEPTGNLDPRNADAVLDLLHHCTRAQAAACLLVTHSPRAAQRADRVLELRADGVHG